MTTLEAFQAAHDAWMAERTNKNATVMSVAKAERRMWELWQQVRTPTI